MSVPLLCTVLLLLSKERAHARGRALPVAPPPDGLGDEHADLLRKSGAVRRRGLRAPIGRDVLSAANRARVLDDTGAVPSGACGVEKQALTREATRARAICNVGAGTSGWQRSIGLVEKSLRGSLCVGARASAVRRGEASRCRG